MLEIDINQIDFKCRHFYKLFSSKNIYNKDKSKELRLKQFKVGARG